MSYNYNMEKQIAIKLAGSASKLAKLLGVERQSEHKWKSIPEGRVWQLKVLKPEWFDKTPKF